MPPSNRLCLRPQRPATGENGPHYQQLRVAPRSSADRSKESLLPHGIERLISMPAPGRGRAARVWGASDRAQRKEQ